MVLTVATDGVNLYKSEVEKARRQYFGGEFDALDAASNDDALSPRNLAIVALRSAS